MYKQIFCNQPQIKLINDKNKDIKILFICGTHGDEPSGDIALHQYNFNSVKNIHVAIIRVNPCGLIQNIRENPNTNFDINRKYGKNDPHNIIIENLVKNYDYIFDFHEGYDYHITNKNSIGSTLSTRNQFNICNIIINNLNKTIKDNNKYFMMVTDKQKIIGSLRDFCDKINKPYVLIETTRKEDLNIRIHKCNIIINTIINYYNL